METLPEARPKTQWVQTPRAAHEAFAQLIMESPLAARVAHLLVSRVADHNAVVISQRTIADLLDCSERGVRDAISLLRRKRWIEVRQIGNRGTVNAYVLNDCVVWSGSRDGLRYSLFSATVVVSEVEQPDRDELGNQAPLHQIPALFPGEAQMPTGPGLPPPSAPSLPGMEPDLPAIELADPEAVRRLTQGAAAQLRADPETGEIYE
jgi:hypothetical protein